MARNDRDRKREEEDELDSKIRESRVKSGSVAAKQADIPSVSGKATVSPEQLVALIEKSEPMIEQLNQLYQMYLAGVEKRPPLQLRQQLDQNFQKIQRTPKPTPMLQFRANTFVQHYQSYTQRWDKLLKDR